MEVLRWKPTPIMALSMPKWSISPSTTATGSAPGSTSSGTSLNMYSAGNSISLDSSSMRPARRNPYHSFLEPSGMPIIRSTMPMSEGNVMPTRLEHVLVTSEQGGGRVPRMDLGLIIGYWPSSGPPPDAAEQIATAERLGFKSVWMSEAYGSDCFTPLAWWGSATSRVQLGTAITQISARTPASTAMTAITLDHLSGGRFILGLGVSGPQVVEGWYSQEYAKPLARTREYIDIVRAIVARDKPVEYVGEHYQMPLVGGTGFGKPLKSIVRPLRTDIPIYLGAEGPKNVALAAEICDGWLPMFFSPKADRFYRDALAEGFARPGARQTPETFEVACVVPTIVGDDVETCADFLRPTLALYIGGMGAKDRNFHKDVFARLGYEEACDKIQEAYLAGRKDEAAGYVSTDMVQDVYLVGPKEKIRDDLEAWRESCVTTLLVSGPPFLLEEIAEIVQG